MNIRLFSQVNFLVLFTVIAPLKAMLIPRVITFKPLDAIEKALVMKAIECKGASALRQEIQSTPEPRLTFDGYSYGVTIPTALHMETHLSLADADKDPLAKEVFKIIEEKELKDGYHPTYRMEVNQSCRLAKKPTNYLTSDTRYFWNNVEHTSVIIEAKFTNKTELLSILEAHE